MDPDMIPNIKPHRYVGTLLDEVMDLQKTLQELRNSIAASTVRLLGEAPLVHVTDGPEGPVQGELFELQFQIAEATELAQSALKLACAFDKI